MNNPVHISRELRNHFWVKILAFLAADPGSGMETILIRVRDSGFKKFGSGINIPSPQHCKRM
jgi:hypothetical protein